VVRVCRKNNQEDILASVLLLLFHSIQDQGEGEGGKEKGKKWQQGKGQHKQHHP
jgi:hypothetical protein